jgi:hypothetical protein
VREEIRRRVFNNMELTVSVVGDEGLPVLREHFQLIPRASA